MSDTPIGKCQRIYETNGYIGRVEVDLAADGALRVWIRRQDQGNGIERTETTIFPRWGLDKRLEDMVTHPASSI